eukprot:GHVO01068101.1.p2 GENE.GHVO01068101.1~~GHVO01068101.1.p2  ORF type:complete len:106 (-),score=0.50 GHVO01068101.1:458-775(-)
MKSSLLHVYSYTRKAPSEMQFRRDISVNPLKTLSRIRHRGHSVSRKSLRPVSFLLESGAKLPCTKTQDDCGWDFSLNASPLGVGLFDGYPTYLCANEVFSRNIAV